MNGEKPLVSIVTPSFNHAQYIEDTIKSVLAQDYPYIEYVIIDGGSIDNTLEIVKKYEDRVQWISEPDDGQAHAINKGFRMSQGEIVAWLNSDDTYCPGAIKTAVDYLLQHSDVCMTYGDGYEIDERGKVIKKFSHTQSFDLRELIYISDYILQPTVFMRREALFGVDLLATSLNWCMDWDLWIRIGKRYKVAYVPFFFANSRISSTTKTSSGGCRRLKEIAYVMRKHGERRYPPGLFIYGFDTLVTVIRRRFPLLYNLGLKYLLHPLKYFGRKVIYRSRGEFKDTRVAK
jgi:glycosyltransferase involved in cell wall biosynthesis